MGQLIDAGFAQFLQLITMSLVPLEGDLLWGHAVFETLQHPHVALLDARVSGSPSTAFERATARTKSRVAMARLAAHDARRVAA
jgi:hypothetical protein